MKYQVRFHAAAERDIAELLSELAPKAGVATALRFVGRIVDYCLDFEIFRSGARVMTKSHRVCAR